MVYYFSTSVGDSDTAYRIYMGRDKVENDPLIRHSHPKDLWFHVDKHSSAHIYLELQEDERLTNFEDLALPSDLLDTLSQLTKANSIRASKLNNVTVIYTPVDNLVSDGSMDIGTVTFKNSKKIKRVVVPKKDNMVVNRVNKTRTEVSTDEFVEAAKQAQMEFERSKRDHQRQLASHQKLAAKQHQLDKARASDPYGDLFTHDNMQGTTNLTIAENYEEDFM